MDYYSEISDLTGEVCYLAVSQKIYVGMPTDIQQLGRENSYCTVIGGKGLVKLSHFSADTRVLLHKVDLDTHLPKIQRRLHSGYPAADDENFT